MPIETPIGNLDIKNATLRTSNLETQNIKIGSIFVNSYPGLETTANVGNTTSNTIQFTNTHTAFTTTGNVSVGGELTVGVTKTFVVTVQEVNSVNKYFINGVDRPVLQLHQHQTYIFDLSSSTLSGHPFVFDSSNSNDGTTNSDPYYTTGITSTGAYGSTEKRTFVVPAGAPTTLYYYCTQHPSMGATVNIGTVTDLVVSGTRGTTLGSGTIAQRSVYPLLGTIRYNTETGYMEAYTASGWGSIATPPTIQTISPASVALVDADTQVFTVTGAFFDTQSTVQLQGVDNTLYDVTDFTFTNSGSIGFKIGTLASGQLANRPFKVVVTNGASLSSSSSTTIGLGAVTWSSPAAGATLTAFYTSAIVTNTELAATDDLGGNAVTYSVVSANLPNPLSLNGGTGAITGTIGAVTTAGGVSVTFRATDNVSGATLDRTFNIVGSAPPVGQQTFTTTGTTTWVAPSGIDSVSVVCVGGGGGGFGWIGAGGGGGGLAWRNNVTVVPGSSYTVTVGAGGLGLQLGGASVSAGTVATGNGGTSSFLTTSATGGQHGRSRHTASQVIAGGTFTGDGGGDGGECEGAHNWQNGSSSYRQSSGGGGAGGYSGTGGTGAGAQSNGGTTVNATAGSGGGGGGGGARLIGLSGSSYGGIGGGGVGLNGQGSNGVAGQGTATSQSSQAQSPANTAGGGGSGGANGNLSPNHTNQGVGGAGGLYGGGGGSGAGGSATNESTGGAGGNGGVRIIWGTGRSFPSNAA